MSRKTLNAIWLDLKTNLDADEPNLASLIIFFCNFSETCLLLSTVASIASRRGENSNFTLRRTKTKHLMLKMLGEHRRSVHRNYGTYYRSKLKL